MTRADLNILLHRQGYRSVTEVQRCVLDPGGTVLIERKGMPDDERQRYEILARLEELKIQMEALRRELPPRAP